MVIAILIISLLNLIANYALIEFAIKRKVADKKEKKQDVPRATTEETSETPVYQDVPDQREDVRTFYGLAKNLQQKWCDLEDDDER